MTNKGKHASGESGGFYRDLIIMILGIILVGAAVFLLLVLIADEPAAETTLPAAASSTTTTTEGVTTTTGATTTTTSTSTTTTTTIPVRPPEEVRVVVLNSIGVAGAAGRMTTRLDEAGYQTLEADDYEPTQDPSRLWYREGFSAEASELLEFIPDALVEPISDETLVEGADVVMILGTGYEE
jgi:hypothetical protein